MRFHLPIDQHSVAKRSNKKKSVTGDTLSTDLLMENIQGISIMDPTDSTLIQSRVLQLQLSCFQIPTVYLKPSSTMTAWRRLHYAWKNITQKERNQTPPASLRLACVNVYLCAQCAMCMPLQSLSVPVKLHFLLRVLSSVHLVHLHQYCTYIQFQCTSTLIKCYHF